MQMSFSHSERKDWKKYTYILHCWERIVTRFIKARRQFEVQLVKKLLKFGNVTKVLNLFKHDRWSWAEIIWVAVLKRKEGGHTAECKKKKRQFLLNIWRQRKQFHCVCVRYYKNVFDDWRRPIYIPKSHIIIYKYSPYIRKKIFSQ